MKYIADYVDSIKDELHGAKEYAEKYVYWKSEGNMQRANKYKEMAQQELQHSMNIHDIAVEEIKKLRELYKPPQKMLDKWEECHVKYVEKSAFVKQILAM